MLNEAMQEMLISADGKALATTGPHGINVVPVSVISVSTDEIVLYDFFMDKTVENLKVEPAVALSAWKGLEGVQVKATAAYVTEGEGYITAVEAMQQQFPERTLKGILLLTPVAVYDVAANLEQAGVQMA